MSTTHHTPIATGAAANAATVNSPLGELDAAIVAVDLTEGGNIDGVLTVRELSPTAGVAASFGGPIEVTDGSGGMMIATDAITITTSTTADVNVKLMTSGAELFMVQVIGGTSLTCLVLVQPTASGVAPKVYILGGHADFQTTSPTGYQLQISANTSNYLFFRAGPSYSVFTVKFISIKMGW